MYFFDNTAYSATRLPSRTPDCRKSPLPPHLSAPPLPATAPDAERTPRPDRRRSRPSPAHGFSRRRRRSPPKNRYLCGMEPGEETKRIHDALRRWWGFAEFRSVQERIIRAAMQGRDTLALMPTGGGKSLTYQVPTMAREGLCIVVTPLIALMKDQVDRLRARRISAVAIHSGLSPRQIDIALDNCVYGDVKFLYVAPERLATEAFRLRVVRMNVSLLAVDEAHCISQWGYDFRPSYLRIAELRERLPGRPGAGPHGLGDGCRGGGHHAPPEVRRAAHRAEQLRPAQPLLQRPPHRRQERPAAPAAAQRRRLGHRLCPHARRGRAGRRPAARGGHRRRGLPRRTGPHGACAPAGGVARGQAPGDGRHQRLRHGHRQARRALRGPLLALRLARRLLSGGGTRRTRRAEGLCAAARGLGRRGAHRPPLRARLPAAGEDQGYLRTHLLLPAHRHRRRRASLHAVQHPRLLRPRAPLPRHRTERPQAAAAERLHDPHRRAGQPGAHPLLREPRRPLQGPHPPGGSRPLHPHAAAPLQRRLHRVPAHRRRGAGHVERLYGRASQGAAQTTVAVAPDPLHPLQPLADPLHGRGAAPARRPLHRPRDLRPPAGAGPRTLRPHAGLRRQRGRSAAASCSKPTSEASTPSPAASATSVWPAGGPRNDARRATPPRPRLRQPEAPLRRVRPQHLRSATRCCAGSPQARPTRIRSATIWAATPHGWPRRSAICWPPDGSAPAREGRVERIGS